MKKPLKTLCAASLAVAAVVSANAQTSTNFTFTSPWVYTPIEKPEGQWMTVEKYFATGGYTTTAQSDLFWLPVGDYELSYDIWYEINNIPGTDSQWGREEFYFADNANQRNQWQQRPGRPNVWTRVTRTFTITGAPWNGRMGFVIVNWGQAPVPSHTRYHLDNVKITETNTNTVAWGDNFEQDAEGAKPSRWNQREWDKYFDVFKITRFFYKNTILILK